MPAPEVLTDKLAQSPSFDGTLHRITNHTANSLVSIHRNKWCHQIYPHNSLLSTTPRSNFSVQCNDACPRSSVMMDEVISILVSTLNLKPKHMVWQMFQQRALFDSPCRCPLILDLHERTLIYMFQSFHSFTHSEGVTCSENGTLRQVLFYISATLTQKLYLDLIKSLQLDKMDRNVGTICGPLSSLAGLVLMEIREFDKLYHILTFPPIHNLYIQWIGQI